MPRFVVLLHETPRHAERPAHWDFMLEDDDALATWALEHEPRTGMHIAAELLPRHRLDYLDYEGPVSRNRGAVTQWDKGTFVWQSRQEHRLVVALRGNQLLGVATLRLQHGRWDFSLNSSMDNGESFQSGTG